MGERWSPSAQSSATLAEEDSANSEVRFQVQQVPFNHATPAPHNRARSGDVMDTVDRVGVEQTEPDHHNEPAFSGPSEQQSQSTRSTLAEEVEGDGPATEAGVHHNIGQPFGGQVTIVPYADRAVHDEQVRLHHGDRTYTAIAAGGPDLSDVLDQNGVLTPQQLRLFQQMVSLEAGLERYVIIDGANDPNRVYASSQMRLVGICYGDEGSIRARVYAAQHALEENEEHRSS